MVRPHPQYRPHICQGLCAGVPVRGGEEDHGEAPVIGPQVGGASIPIDPHQLLFLR